MNVQMTPRVGIGVGAALALLVILWLLFSAGDDPQTEPVLPGPANGTASTENSPQTPTNNGERIAVGDPRYGTPNEDPLPAKNSLTVRVVDEKGVVVEGAHVGVTGPDGQSQFSLRRPDDAHEFRDLNPGDWRVLTYAVGYLDDAQSVELLEAETEKEFTVHLTRAPLFPVRFLTPTGEDAVAVLDALEGSPLRGADLFVIATREVPGQRIPRLAPGARPQYGVGLFHFASSLKHEGAAIPDPGEGYAGVLELKSAPPVHVSCVLRETVLETLQVQGTGNQNLTFTVVPEHLQRQLASASVVVLDERTRLPIDKVQVTCDDTGIAGSGKDGSSADEAGRFVFEQRFPGWATLRAWAPGYELVQKSVQLLAGEQTDLGTVYLAPEVSVSGRVTDEAGKGIRSIVFARDENWGSEDAPPELGHTLGSSGNDGSLNLERLGHRRYELLVQSTGFALKSVTLDLTDGESAELNIQLERGTRTVLAARYPADRTDQVSVFDSGGKLCFYERIPGQRSRPAWLAPGTYTLVTQHGPEERSRRTIEITDESATFDLD